MKFIRNQVRRLREREISRIEARVGELSYFLSNLDEDVWPHEYADAERERARLWLRRSDLIRRTDPAYQGAS